MSELPKCKLCGADAAVHKVFGGIKYCCSSETCTMHDVLMLKSQWRTLMTQQQAEPSQVPTGHVFLPEITPEMWETLGDTDVMTWIDGPQWTQIAVDFASMLPVKMPAQHPDQDRLRYKSACEISGEKHPEYVSGYEAAMDAVCNSQQAAPVVCTFYVLHDATGGQKYIKKDVDDGCLAIFEMEEDARRAKRRHPGTEYKRVDYYTAPPAQPAQTNKESTDAKNSD